MTQAEIYEVLDEMFNDIFLRDDIKLTPDTTASDIEGWDSFRMIEIVIAVQDRFKVKFHTRDLENLKNVSDLVSVISSSKV